MRSLTCLPVFKYGDWASRISRNRSMVPSQPLGLLPPQAAQYLNFFATQISSAKAFRENLGSQTSSVVIRGLTIGRNTLPYFEVRL
jgi:hypothetical protein